MLIFRVVWLFLGVSENSGTPKWMVYNGKPIKMDDLGVPLFSETPSWQSDLNVRLGPAKLCQVVPRLQLSRHKKRGSCDEFGDSPLYNKALFLGRGGWHLGWSFLDSH